MKKLCKVSIKLLSLGTDFVDYLYTAVPFRLGTLFKTRSLCKVELIELTVNDCTEVLIKRFEDMEKAYQSFKTKTVWGNFH